MWKWITGRESTARHVAKADAPAVEQQTGRPPGKTGKVPGTYVSLHKYLANRYADVVVLTFAQLEDLLGCALPESARTQHEWWTRTDDADKLPCSNAWILAGRTARPNLPARTVTFERSASATWDPSALCVSE